LACIEAGSYTVTITDANNVTATETFVIEPAVNCTADETIVIPCGDELATVTVTPTFGVGPYTYGWANDDGTALPLPDPCTDRDWANFEDLNGTGSGNVENVNTPIVENAINSAPFVIQGAVMTVQEPVFAAGATIDEELINDSQLNGTFALRTGVNHPGIDGEAIGGANMSRTITFDKPVCDLNMFFNDIDNNDVAVIIPRLNGTNVTVTPADYVLTGTNVTVVGGNRFESISDIGLNNTADGGVDFTFTSCIDEIEIIFFDDVAGPGVGDSEGGSYSISFPPVVMM